MIGDQLQAELSQDQFLSISRQVYKTSGIKLEEGKEHLVKSRLSVRLRTLGLNDFDHYLSYVERDRTGHELSNMIDALTTNKTSFFREQQHWDFLRRHVIPDLRANAERIRIWSAGCSSGKEAYTVAMLLREEIPDIARRDVQILGTDISTKILAEAKEAVYDDDITAEVPAHLVKKYFRPVSKAPARQYQLNDNVRSMVRLARLNLMERWPLKGPFDVIFCRNVMIYFDKPTQTALAHRFWELLKPGGHFLIGHSESVSATSEEFKYVQPAVYEK